MDDFRVSRASVVATLCRAFGHATWLVAVAVLLSLRMAAAGGASWLYVAVVAAVLLYLCSVALAKARDILARTTGWPASERLCLLAMVLAGCLAGGLLGMVAWAALPVIPLGI